MRAFFSRLVALVVFVVVAVGGGTSLWAALAPAAGSAARVAVVSDDRVAVTTDPFLTFDPGDADTGLVLYPGARVRPEAYAPVARMIAEAGYLVVVPDMPLHLAILAPARADRVLAAHPEVDRWVIGGHSLGGAMAATYANLSSDVEGLVLWAAYPAGSVDLSNRAELASVTVVGTLDGVIDQAATNASADRLPPGHDVVWIDGGNHAQFGDYGTQRGDGAAEISAREQWSLAANETIAVIDAVAGG